MLLYHAKFSENGGIRNGYILKPEWMRHDAEVSKYPSMDFKNPQY